MCQPIPLAAQPFPCQPAQTANQRGKHASHVSDDPCKSALPAHRTDQNVPAVPPLLLTLLQPHNMILTPPRSEGSLALHKGTPAPYLSVYSCFGTSVNAHAGSPTEIKDPFPETEFQECMKHMMDRPSVDCTKKSIMDHPV